MVIYPGTGTMVLGSNFDQLVTTFRDRANDDYVHQVTGILRYHDDWALVSVDDDIMHYYATQVYRRFGIRLQTKTPWGAHISAIRGEPISDNIDKWGHNEGQEILIKYTHQVYTNGKHWWLNVLCEDLATIRESYGLKTRKHWFHMTIGRL